MHHKKSLARVKNKSKLAQGFTIVELLVVIVVIGILAAITIVSYTGITLKATAASLQSDLKNASTILEMDKTINGTYPATKEAANGGRGLPSSSGVALDYKYSNGSDSYSLGTTKNNTSYYITSDNKTPTIGSIPSAPVANTFAVAWGGTGYDYGTSIIKTSDGGYAVTGETDSYGVGNGKYDMFLAKYNSDGNLSWNKTWGGTGNDSGNSLIQTSDGGYAITGDTLSYGTVNGDMFIAKYDSAGNLSWNKTWGGPTNDSGKSIVQAADGGYVVAGNTSSFGGIGIFLAKYTSLGNLSWNKAWDNGTHVTVYALIKTSDGGYAVTGGTSKYDGNGDNILLAKYDSDGNLSWNKTWGNIKSDIGYSLIQTSDGGYAVTGRTGGFGAGNDDMIMIKYDSAGNLSWNKTWGNVGYDSGNAIVQTSDGGYAVTGWTEGLGIGNCDMFLVKYDSTGNLLWNKIWVGGDYSFGNSLVYTNDGGYAVAGEIDTEANGWGDMFIVKYNASGNISNCTEQMCQTPTAVSTTPTADVDTLINAVISPAATVIDPTATETSPEAMITTIVAP